MANKANPANKTNKANQVLTTTIEPVFSPKKKTSRKAYKLLRKSKKRIKECLSKVKRTGKRVAKNDEIRASSRRSLNKSSSSVSNSPSLKNLWDKAISKNQKLEEWIHEYNEQMDKVDECELSIVSE